MDEYEQLGHMTKIEQTINSKAILCPITALSKNRAPLRNYELYSMHQPKPLRVYHETMKRT